jgi:hypothetical protein
MHCLMQGSWLRHTTIMTRDVPRQRINTSLLCSHVWTPHGNLNAAACVLCHVFRVQPVVPTLPSRPRCRCWQHWLHRTEAPISQSTQEGITFSHDEPQFCLQQKARQRFGSHLLRLLGGRRPWRTEAMASGPW